MSSSIAQRLKRDREITQHAAENPSFASWVREARAIYGDNWDPESDCAKCVRAIGYADSFLAFAVETAGVDGRDEMIARDFALTRELLVAHVHPAFGELELGRALELMKAPQRGFRGGGAALIGKWSAEVDAFGDRVRGPKKAAVRYRGASAEARRTDRSRAK